MFMYSIISQVKVEQYLLVLALAVLLGFLLGNIINAKIVRNVDCLLLFHTKITGQILIKL